MQIKKHLFGPQTTLVAPIKKVENYDTLRFDQWDGLIPNLATMYDYRAPAGHIYQNFNDFVKLDPRTIDSSR